MARAYWPNQNAVGKVFEHDDVPTRVIGVVGDVKEWGIRQKTIPQAYFPLSEILIVPGFGGELVVKTGVSPTSVLSAIRSEVRGSDGSLAVFNPRTMDQVIAESMEDTSVQTLLLGVFAALAMILAAVGIYGVMAYVVTQQTHEIGIRMALGAQRADVLRMVLSQGGKLTALGVCVGVAAALGLTSLMRSLLFRSAIRRSSHVCDRSSPARGRCSCGLLHPGTPGYACGSYGRVEVRMRPFGGSVRNCDN